MGVIHKNAELALVEALSRRPLPESVAVRLCFGGPMNVSLADAVRWYDQRRRSGSDDGIVAARQDVLDVVDELLGRG